MFLWFQVSGFKFQVSSFKFQVVSLVAFVLFVLLHLDGTDGTDGTRPDSRVWQIVTIAPCLAIFPIFRILPLGEFGGASISQLTGRARCVKRGGTPKTHAAFGLPLP